MITQKFDDVFTFEALYRAHLKGRLCKRDKRPLVRFELRTLQHLYALFKKLQNGKFNFGVYSSFVVYEPKKREIQTLPYSARVIQHIICDDVLMPYFSARAIADNCVCQLGKGTHFALKRFENMLHTFIRKHGVNGYFLKCDILKYFPSIPHDGIKRTFLSHIADEKLRALVESIIDGYHTNPDYLKKYGIQPLGNANSERGVPIGNQTSQIFGMFYLDKLDRVIKEQLRIKVYSRYMDDILLAHHDKQVLKDALDTIKSMLADMGLKLNSKTQIFPLKNGVTYLGFRYHVTDTGKVIKTVKKPTKRRIRWRVRLLKKAFIGRYIDTERLKVSLASMYGHIAHARSFKLKKEIDDKLGAYCAF
ncbi:MAG: RNA-directed DNA polymerase [Bacteroides sp.]|nr:RNA-directed DNA polymerase [[Eubacterium] siraeum]MCM1455927.1 RNA-directed DNA polymerase [Bacteroides sp.]